MTCEESFHEALDYIKYGYEPNPAALNTDRFNPGHRRIYRGSTCRLTIVAWKKDSFRDRFKSMITDNSSLKNVDRMHYLGSCLTEEASNALSNLAVTNSNSPIAWDILVNRYENKCHLIIVYLRSFFDLTSPRDLQRFPYGFLSRSS